MAEQAAGNKPPMSNMIWMMLALGVMIIIFIPGIRSTIGKALNAVFEPTIGFGGDYIVITLMLAGMIMIGISTIIRTLMMDTVSQAKNQKEMSAFNAELRQARIENNLYKIKKLTEMQSEMMSRSMQSSMKMMKTMPITMLVVVPMFSWIWYYMDTILTLEQKVIAVPWSDYVLLTDSIALPVWVLMYMLVTIPFGQLLGRLIRWFKFKKRLQELETTGPGLA